MAYRNKTYVCFDADNDIHYYRLMCAWKANTHAQFNFHDAHQLNNLASRAGELQIKRKLRERLSNTKLMMVLIGQSTRFLYKFVRWEMEVALSLGVPIVGVNLNKLRWMDEERCPPIIRDKLALHVAFGVRICAHAIDSWPTTHLQLVREGASGPHYYNDDVYRSLGIAL